MKAVKGHRLTLSGKSASCECGWQVEEKSQAAAWRAHQAHKALWADSPEPVKVTIYGPNLPVDGETFHVHAEGCADLKRGIYPTLTDHSDGWKITVTNEQALVEAIYCDIISEAESTWDDPAYRNDIRIFPCVTLH